MPTELEKTMLSDLKRDMLSVISRQSRLVDEVASRQGLGENLRGLLVLDLQRSIEQACGVLQSVDAAIQGALLSESGEEEEAG